MRLGKWRFSKVWHPLMVVFLLGSVPAFASSQDSSQFFSNWRLGATVHYGVITPHQGSIAYALERNIGALELQLSSQPPPENEWGARYRYPRWGASYYYSGLGNYEVFGRAHALLFFADIPFTPAGHRFSVNYQLGLGPAYLTRTFSVEDNPLNIAISSHTNLFVRFRFSSRWQLDARNELDAGISFSHFSNAKMASPNLGLNGVLLGVGYQHRLTTSLPMHAKPRPVLPPKRKQGVDLIFSGGGKADDQVSGKTYLISSLVADYRYALSSKYSCGIGSDFFYDQTLGVNKEAKTGNRASKNDMWQAGVHGVFNVHYARLNVVMNIGSYVFYSYYKYARVYTRLGLRYEVAPHVLLNFTLKSHYAIADYLEWGVGYRF